MKKLLLNEVNLISGGNRIYACQCINGNKDTITVKEKHNKFEFNQNLNSLILALSIEEISINAQVSFMCNDFCKTNGGVAILELIGDY